MAASASAFAFRHLVRLVLPVIAVFGLAACEAGSGEVASAKPTAVVYKTPTCGCCTDWVEHLEAAGYPVEVHERQDLTPIKREHGLPYGMGSCHTALIDGYLVEGHVPAADIDRLLAERPDAKGLAVPGMPIGSPGMEMGDRQDAYTVYLLEPEGPSAFSRYPASGTEG